MTILARQSADACQQRFSSENEPALHLTLPALEDLHACWTERLQNDHYKYFEASLQSGLDKISEYYDKTGDNDAYVFSIRAYITAYMNQMST